MAQKNNRIEGLGSLRLISHEDLNKTFDKVLIGGRDRAATESERRRFEEWLTVSKAREKSPHYRTTLALHIDDPDYYMVLGTHVGWAGLECLLSVSTEGVWDAFDPSSEGDDDTEDLSEEDRKQLNREWRKLNAGGIMPIYPPRPLQVKRESLKRLTQYWSDHPVGQLLARLAQSLDYRETPSIMYVSFPRKMGGDFCRMVSLGQPYLELTFEPKEIRDMSLILNSLARKMSKWWREIHADYTCL